MQACVYVVLKVSINFHFLHGGARAAADVDGAYERDDEDPEEVEAVLLDDGRRVVHHKRIRVHCVGNALDGAEVWRYMDKAPARIWTMPHTTHPQHRLSHARERQF